MGRFNWFTLILVYSCVSVDLSSEEELTDSADVVKFTWEVGTKIMTLLQCPGKLESPMFSTWAGLEERKWSLALSIGCSGKLDLFVTSRDDRIVNSHTHMTGVELILLNDTPENNLRKTLEDRLSSVSDAQGWERIIDLKTIVDSENGFVFNGKVKFEARFPSDPAQPQQNLEHFKTINFLWNIPVSKLEGLSPNNFEDSPELYTMNENNSLSRWVFRLHPNWQYPDFIPLWINIVNSSPVAVNVEMTLQNERVENTIRRWDHINKPWNHETGHPMPKDFINSTLILDPANEFIIDDAIIIGIRIQPIVIKSQVNKNK